jgi:hypothetical protein
VSRAHDYAAKSPFPSAIGFATAGDVIADADWAPRRVLASPRRVGVSFDPRNTLSVKAGIGFTGGIAKGCLKGWDRLVIDALVHSRGNALVREQCRHQIRG